MKIKEKKTTIILAVALVTITLTVGTAFFFFREKPGYSSLEQFPDSFTFFDLGANSRFTRSMRSELKKILGADSIAYRGTLDLVVHDRQFMTTHFNSLYQLHEALNSPVGERVEHNVVRLTYRYPWRRDSPFKHVDLVFSNYNGLPLIFHTVMTGDGSRILDSLIQKYGEPLEIPVGDRSRKVMYWKKDRDILIVSVKPDRLGGLEYEVKIYFVNSLLSLLETEKEETRIREEKIRRAADKAF